MSAYPAAPPPDAPRLSVRRLRDAVRLYVYFLWPDRGGHRSIFLSYACCGIIAAPQPAHGMMPNPSGGLDICLEVW